MPHRTTKHNNNSILTKEHIEETLGCFPASLGNELFLVLFVLHLDKEGHDVLVEEQLQQFEVDFHINMIFVYNNAEVS